MSALSGGVGGAKLALGFYRVLKSGELAVIVNTGDDFELFGLHISPDLDIVMYTLAGIVDEQRGWGVKGDTFEVLEALNRHYHLERWFSLGDKDMATHIYRTSLLAQGYRLSEATEKLCSALGVSGARIVPMTDNDVETKIKLQDGSLVHFQEYFVKRGCRDPVAGVLYKGSRTARPAKGVLESLAESDLIVICPSNPIASIGPILSISGINQLLKKARCPVVAVSPIVQGKPLKGPADKFMRGLGLEVSAVGVARFYRQLIDYFVLDQVDAHWEEDIRSMGIRTVTTNTIMSSLEDKTKLARRILRIGSDG